MPWASEGELVPFIAELTSIKSIYLESFEVISSGSKYLAYEIGKDGMELLIVMNIKNKPSAVEVPFTGTLKNYYTGELIKASETFTLNMEPVSTLFFIID